MNVIEHNESNNCNGGVDRTNLDNDRSMTTGEAGAALGVHAQTIRVYITAGKLDAVALPSGHRRVTRASVDRILGGTA